MVGAVSFWIKPDLAHGDAVVEVPMLVVAEDHRRTGVGKLLCRGAGGRRRARRLLIELVATRSNVAAREFYQSLGFVEADVVALEFVGSREPSPRKT